MLFVDLYVCAMYVFMSSQTCLQSGIRVIIDFVAGHTSSDHPWFRDSVNRVSPYTDFYIWANGTVQEDGTISPPNNWV